MIDDDALVTRAVLREELREALTRYPTRDELKQELARFASKDELKQELARFATKDELKQELARSASKDELGQVVQVIAQQHETLLRAIDQRFGQFEQLSAERHEWLLGEIARSARVAAEEHRRELGVLDDRYRELPGRVTTLERELDEHRRDGALHARSRRPPRPR